MKLAHPILKSLEGTREKWIIDVLYAFNAGDLNKFNEYRPQWAEWDDLKDHQDLLEDKIRLLSLMEVISLHNFVFCFLEFILVNRSCM